METKDILFSIGIFVTLIIGVINIYLTYKNRTNNLREHIYKEQTKICNLLIDQFVQLNFHISALYDDENIKNESPEKFEKIGEIISKNEHILPNHIITLSNETLYKCQPFFEALATKDRNRIKLGYDAYFENYFLLIILLRDYFGIDDLSKENQKLYKLPRYYKSVIEKFNKDNA